MKTGPAEKEKVERLRLSSTRDGEDELSRGDLKSLSEALQAEPAVDTLERELGHTVTQARAHPRNPTVPARLLHHGHGYAGRWRVAAVSVLTGHLTLSQPSPS